MLKSGRSKVGKDVWNDGRWHGVKSIGVYDEIILYGYMIQKWIHFVCLLFYVHFF